MGAKCPYCSSSKRTWRKGLRYNKSGEKQMWWCNACKRRFTIDDGFSITSPADIKDIKSALRTRIIPN